MRADLIRANYQRILTELCEIGFQKLRTTSQISEVEAVTESLKISARGAAVTVRTLRVVQDGTMLGLHIFI